jgi:hypothetical protein
MGADLLQDPSLLFAVQATATASIAARLGMQGGKAAFLPGIPPVLKGSHSDTEISSLIVKVGRVGDLGQGMAQPYALADPLFHTAGAGKATQGDSFGSINRIIGFHTWGI